MSKLMPCGIAAGLALFVSVGCTNASNEEAAVQRMEAQVASLSARISALEGAQARAAAASSGAWILWQRIDVLKSIYALAAAPAAQPMGAYDSKEECEREAQSIAARHGASDGNAEYIFKDAAMTVRTFFTCMPKGVAISS